MQLLSGTVYDENKIPPNDENAEGKEQNVVAGDESTFDWSLQSKDPQDDMTFKTLPMNTKTEMKSELNYVTDKIDTRHIVQPPQEAQPVFEGEIGALTEAEEYAYQEDILSEMQLLSGTVYDVDKVPPNDENADPKE